ncbi:MAG TPA: response regulator transcription factor [Flavobacteriales bacterium]|nr:response regulator transcription factor [Flavobacteriales bacterium]
MSAKPIRVAVVEDDSEIRQLLRNMLVRAEQLQVVGSYPDADAFLAELDRIVPDVVLMDIGLPGMNGIECVRAAKPQHPSVQYLMSTVFESPAYIHEALCAGATGYLVKNAEPESIIAAVRDIHAGGSPMSPAIARLVVASFQQQAQREIQDQLLTEREKGILDQLANGLMYKEIAAKAGISTETVRKHVRNIYEKLQVSSRHEAVRKVYPGR